MRALLVALGAVLVFACASDGDSQPEPMETVTGENHLSPDCNLLAPFGPVQPAFTGTLLVDGVTFSHDERTAYVSTKTTSAGYDIQVATRALTTDSFGALATVAVLNGNQDDRAPALSQDGLKLYLTKLNPSSSWSYDLALATRSNVTDPFGSPQYLNSLNASVFHDQDPFFLSANSQLSSDQLYFASEQPTGVRDLYVSTLSSGAYSAPAGLSVNTSSDEDYRPVLTADALRLYFASTRSGIGGDTEGDIFTAIRSASNGTFSAVTNLYGLNSSYREYPVTLSSDGCTLYFASSRDTGNFQNLRLYQAKRGSTIPTTVTVTLNIVGSGSVNTTPFQCSTTCSGQGAPDSTLVVQASGPAMWSGSCTGNNGQPSVDGVVVFTPGGTCTVSFTGACGSSQPVPVDDGNPCTVDSCDPVQGILHVPVATGTSCSNGNVCDGAEQCTSTGFCAAGTPPNLDDGNPCTIDSCNGSGIQHIPASQGTPCADGNLCNGNELCNSQGQCQAGTPPNPDDGNPCTFDACDSQTGVSHTLLPTGTSCADEDSCDGDETCSSTGLCQGVAPSPLPEECEEDPPESTRCGDGIRDPVDEECDDGPGEAADTCAADCRVTDISVAPIERVAGTRRSRTLGFGRHPLATGTRGTLVSYVELEDSASQLRGALFGSRGEPRSLLDLGAGADPSQYADASVAALAPDVFAVAWNDLGGGSLDVGLRLVTGGSSPALGEVVRGNSMTAGAQQDPDLLWTGTELVAAWSSEFVVQARRFDAHLKPIAADQQLGLSNELSGSISLARVGSTWAAAWRALDAEGDEAIRVHMGSTDWSVGPYLPGAEWEPPALVELDASNLLVVFTEGTDPFETGTPSVTRLRGAVLNVSEPGPSDSFPLDSFVEPYASDDSIAQARPTLARTGTRLFLGWQTESVLGSSLAAELWIQELAWDPGTGVISDTERPVPITSGRDEPQLAPAFAPSPLFPDGALAIAWEQHAEAWPYGARPDIVFSLRPVPFVTLP